MALLASACGGADGTDGLDASEPPTPEPTSEAATPEPVAVPEPTVEPDPTPTDPTAPAADPVELPALAGPSATAVVLQDAGPRITAVVYPRPDYEGDPWSQWGQGVVLPDGRVVSAIGDHLGRGGNSYVFVYDPSSGVITRIGDVAAALDHPADSWGFGKVHGQMVLADDGDVYFATYWGSRRDIEFDDAYQGDVLFRLDTATFTLEPLGVPVPRHGVPSLAGDGRYLYGEAVDPLSDPESGGLFVYDTVEREVVAWLPDQRHDQFRNVIVDAAGALVTTRDGDLLRYETGADALALSPVSLGDRLRASTPPDADGVVYTVTTKDHRLAAIEPGGAVRPLGTALDYSASLALTPDGTGIVYAPGARGDAPAFGTPVISVDTATGDQTVIAELDRLARDGLGLVLGGSYNVTVDAARGLVHVGFNAGPDDESPWGEVVLVTIELGGTRGEPAAAASLEPATEAFGLVDPLLGIRGHAVAVADVDGDGWDDVFVGTFADRPPETYAVRGADGPAPDRLLLGGPDGYRLDPDFPGRLSRSAGATFADLDGDGDPDLVVSRNVRKDVVGTEILRNDGGSFEPVAVLDDSRGGRAVGTLDYDGDGDLDVFLVEDRWSGASSALFRNDGGFRFTDQTAAAGLPADVFGLGLGIADLDGNGRDDLVIGGSNRIFLGDEAGGFTESQATDLEWETYGPEDDVAHVAIGDVDGDGRPDVVLGQHYNSTLDFDERVPVRLYLNEEAGDRGVRLRDVTEAAGLVPLPTKAPKVLLVDLNGDGWLDLVTTAAAGGGASPAVFFHQGVVDGVPRFSAPAGLGDAQYWIDAAVVDADRDGRDDLFLVEWEPSIGSVLFRNAAP